MFFPKLRRRAKWVFLFLALAFGIGFVAFGVGTGVPGASLGDVFQDFVGQRNSSAEASVENAAKKVSANPNDAEAQLEYANALQQAGRPQDAIGALEQYTRLRPKDADALRQLAVLYGTVAARAREEAQVAQAAAQQAALPQSFAGQSEFGRAVAENKIAATIADAANARAQAASVRAQAASQQETRIYEQLTLLTPDDATTWLQLGAAAQGAQNYEAAIAAYEKFLELAPDDANAPAVREQLDLLKQLQGIGG